MASRLISHRLSDSVEIARRFGAGVAAHRRAVRSRPITMICSAIALTAFNAVVALDAIAHGPYAFGASILTGLLFLVALVRFDCVRLQHRCPGQHLSGTCQLKSRVVYKKRYGCMRKQELLEFCVANSGDEELTHSLEILTKLIDRFMELTSDAPNGACLRADQALVLLRHEYTENQECKALGVIESMLLHQGDELYEAEPAFA